MSKSKFVSSLFGLLVFVFVIFAHSAHAAYHFASFRGRPPIHVLGGSHALPVGLSPEQIKQIYHLPVSGGRGTIAIIGAYENKSIETDLNIFSKQFNLPACTVASKCFEKHVLSETMGSNSGWGMETALDVEWAHAIAPEAKILLVEAATPSGAQLLKAVDYAASRSDVVAVSMSWGGKEFPEEVSLDSHFKSGSGAEFFASSGDAGYGASWPASSPNVVAVGGTTITLDANGGFVKEVAWPGSGGGVSSYEPAPAWQKDYGLPKSNGMRAIPDVSYNADAKSGFPIVRLGKWYTVGGTSAGSPQWAGIASLGRDVDAQHFYTDKASSAHAQYFRDITSGSNGDCAYYCDARKHYDYVTGLGSPLTVHF